MRTITMHRLQDLVRLHRLGNGAREVARLLEMSPNTERDYRLALSEAGLLEGDPTQLPELTILRAALEASRPAKPLVPQQTSSVEKWRATIEALANDGASPTAIYIAEIFASDDVLCQLTKVQAIVRHLEAFPIPRARAACRRASFYGSYSYLAIKNILLKGLDLEPLPSLVVPSSDAEPPRFARNVLELLDLTMDPNDAPH
jgi:hypothetical protein